MTKIVVNHLTRMRNSRVCVAGVEAESDRHLRPVTAREDLLTRRLLAEEGGPLGVGAEIDLGPTSPRPNPPESEDHFCESSNLEQLRMLDGDEYLELLERVAADSLAAAFGPALERCGGSHAVAFGEGAVSLTCVRGDGHLRLRIRYGTPKLALSDGSLVPVTDLRFFEADQKTVRAEVCQHVGERLADGTGAWVMFGLARPWRKPGDDEKRHWLQVNGICLEDAPLGPRP